MNYLYNAASNISPEVITELKNLSKEYEKKECEKKENEKKEYERIETLVQSSVTTRNINHNISNTSINNNTSNSNIKKQRNKISKKDYQRSISNETLKEPISTVIPQITLPDLVPCNSETTDGKVTNNVFENKEKEKIVIIEKGSKQYEHLTTMGSILVDGIERLSSNNNNSNSIFNSNGINKQEKLNELLCHVRFCKNNKCSVKYCNLSRTILVHYAKCRSKHLKTKNQVNETNSCSLCSDINKKRKYDSINETIGTNNSVDGSNYENQFKRTV